MYLLSSKGRIALLTFLRNLTPQALLLSVGLILYVRWRTDQDATSAILAICTLAVLVMAMIANLDEFLDSAFSKSDDISSHLASVKKDEKSVLK